MVFEALEHVGESNRGELYLLWMLSFSVIWREENPERNTSHSSQVMLTTRVFCPLQTPIQSMAAAGSCPLELNFIQV